MPKTSILSRFYELGKYHAQDRAGVEMVTPLDVKMNEAALRDLCADLGEPQYCRGTIGLARARAYIRGWNSIALKMEASGETEEFFRREYGCRCPR